MNRLKCRIKETKLVSLRYDRNVQTLDSKVVGTYSGSAMLARHITFCWVVTLTAGFEETIKRALLAYCRRHEKLKFWKKNE